MGDRSNNDRGGGNSDSCRERQVQINNSIAQHGKRKELDEAMALFREALQLNCDNSHTYAAIINANIRCGKLAAASDIYQQMLKKGRKKDVIICTTLLKGYCLMEDMLNAVELYVSMLSNKPTAIIPNIRTINTMLRGCIFIGEVGLCELLTATAQREHKLQLDITSWEYLMTLLTQSLQLDKAMPILGRLKAMLTQLNSEEVVEGDSCSSSSVNTLLSVHVNTARAAAMLGDWKLCNKLCLAAREGGGGGGCVTARRNNDQPTTVSSGAVVAEQDDRVEKMMKKKGLDTSAAKVIGGKRAWHSSANDDDDGDRRTESLRLYQEHTSAELLEEVGLIDRFRLQQMGGGGGGGVGGGQVISSSISSVAHFEYMFPFFLKLFPFSKDYLSFGADDCDTTSATPSTTIRGGPAAAGGSIATRDSASSSSSSSSSMIDLSTLSEKERRRVIKKSVVKSIIYRVEESFGLGVFSRRLCGQSCDQIAGYSVGTPSYIKVLSAAKTIDDVKTGRSKGTKRSKKNPTEQLQQQPHHTSTTITTTTTSTTTTAAAVTTESNSSKQQPQQPPRSLIELRIASYRALVAKSFDSSGRLNFDSIYGGEGSRRGPGDRGTDAVGAVTRPTVTGRPLKMEICSGAGEWAVAQVLLTD